MDTVNPANGIPRNVPLVWWAQPHKMHLAAHDEWRDAWERGLVSDVEMAWYQTLINRHPASWLGWLKYSYLGG